MLVANDEAKNIGLPYYPDALEGRLKTSETGLTTSAQKLAPDAFEGREHHPVVELKSWPSS